ncbi:MAG: class I SAM-dependent methyltransferase [Planctomycetota bacterium]|nr:class I SAM-dependent methyltransferase [Planctomycetota bacterium]
MESTVEAVLKELIHLPRGRQAAYLESALEALPKPESKEEWNTRFGAGTLFEAWTASSVASAIYQSNAKIIQRHLKDRKDWRILEIGGGDGRLWSRVFDKDSQGQLHVIDPAPEVHEQMQRIVPDGVSLHSQVALAQDAEFLDVDLVVCSLTLHHVPGADAAECEDRGIEGPGKLFILKKMKEAIRKRCGLAILNEADIYCDIGLAQSDEILIDRLIDSYVRRCGLSLLHDIEGPTGSDDMKARWRAIARHWCLEQVAMGHMSLADRDVYELDVPRWLGLIARAGFDIESHQFTDDYGLFHQYLLN